VFAKTSRRLMHFATEDIRAHSIRKRKSARDPRGSANWNPAKTAICHEPDASIAETSCNPQTWPVNSSRPPFRRVPLNYEGRALSRTDPRFLFAARVRDAIAYAGRGRRGEAVTNKCTASARRDTLRSRDGGAKRATRARPRVNRLDRRRRARGEGESREGEDGLSRTR